MNTNPEESAKPSQKGHHLDEFPEEADQIAWERAVLERAQVTGIFTPLRSNTKEDLFWQKLKAYEAREISKRRQRYKPSRLERFDELAESRVQRGIRHGLVDDVEMKCETKMRRRAERFGIDENRAVDGVLQGGVLDWMTDEQRLKMRRARFEKEPRHDEFYRREWASESGGAEGIMDEQRMAERTRRFSGRTKSHKNSNAEDGDRMNVEMGEKCRIGNNVVENIQDKDPFSGIENRTKSREAVEQEGGQVLQEWERTYESWGDVEDAGVEGEHVPDAVEVDEIRRVTEDTQMMELTKENLLSMTSRNEGSGKILQSWEAGGEEW